MPCDSLFARSYHEFRKRVVSVYPLARVKCMEYQGTVMVKPRKTPIAPGVVLSIEGDAELPGQHFQSVLEVLVAIQILVNTWALTGTEVVTSTVDPRQTGLDADYDNGMAYYGFSFEDRQVRQLHGS